jgi:eukaryotic-like serine/threonine-protein kinase
MIGTKLAHYEITSHLGSGGMGDVYQATDSKLGRSVAIKFLPEAFSHDSERVARFQREARVLASLNHPNIAAIHGLEESGHRKFLVMELVGGETLAERIKRGPIPVDESLQIAKQICEALEAAHEKGIIHRDLKPANVKITPEGKVKVLDFGLAKAFAADVAEVNLSNSPTLSQAGTNAGIILGTAAYMSPEQAKGAAVDRRTDIFAFGSVLYEMLTGRRAFPGETVTEILARVIEREPEWNRLPQNTPAGIRRLIERSLRKDRGRRLQTATDARIEIEDARTEPQPSHQAVTSVAPRMLARLMWLVALLVFTVAATLTMVYFFAPAGAPDTPETRVDIVTPATTDPISFALSPDGRQLVFAASGDGPPRLWLRSLDKVMAQPLTGTEGASYPFWSPDSRSVGFFDGIKLKRIEITGGSPQTLADAFNRGGAWSPEGVILYSQTARSPLFRIPASGGKPVAVTVLTEKQQSHRFPHFLPDGRHFLFYVQGSPETGGIYLGSLDAREAKRLTTADAAGVYAPAGWLLFIREGTLMAQRLDLARGELSGDPVTVADRVTFDGNNTGAVSVSATGLVAYRAGGVNGRQLAWFDRSGKPLGTLLTPDQNNLSAPRLSPDGRRIAVARMVQGNNDIWIVDADRATRFTFGQSIERFPMWSPDGNRIVFSSSPKGPSDIYQKSSSGSGSEEPLLESSENKTPRDWSSDGRFILYENTAPTAASSDADLWVLPTEGARKPFVFLKTNFRELAGQFSPDVRWVAYMSNESGRFEIYVRPFPGPGGQWQVSTSGGIYPRWKPDGKELYYIGPDGSVMAVPIAIKGATVEPGRPVSLFRTRMYGGSTDVSVGAEYDVARDGRFLIDTIPGDASSPITLLQNWKPPAK